MDAETGSTEDRRGGDPDEVSPWFEGLSGAVFQAAEARVFGSQGREDGDYRDVVPGVDYMPGFRDARSAEAEVLATLRGRLEADGAWLRTEKLITRLGVGVVRVDMPAFAWREELALIRDGLRYRAERGCPTL